MLWYIDDANACEARQHRWLLQTCDRPKEKHYAARKRHTLKAPAMDDGCSPFDQPERRLTRRAASNARCCLPLHGLSYPCTRLDLLFVDLLFPLTTLFSPLIIKSIPSLTSAVTTVTMLAMARNIAFWAVLVVVVQSEHNRCSHATIKTATC